MVTIKGGVSMIISGGDNFMLSSVFAMSVDARSNPK